MLLPYFDDVVFTLDYERAIRDEVVAPVRVALLGVSFTRAERAEYEDLGEHVSRARTRLVRGFGIPSEPFGEFIAEVNRLARHGTREEGMAAGRFLRHWQARRALMAESPAKRAVLDRLVKPLSVADRSLVFTQTIDSADDLAARLCALGVPSQAHHSGVPRDARAAMLDAFRSGQLKVVATAQTLNEGVDVPEADLAVIMAAVTAAVDLGDDADTVGCVAGSIAGARWGIQAIPSRWTTYLNGSLTTPDGEMRYDYAALQDLARRLFGSVPVPPTVPEVPKPPVRVHDTLPVYAADWKGAATAPTEWAIVSLCRTHGDFSGHPVRREVFLIDRYDESDNHAPAAALRDAIDTIDALLDEDPERPVLAHCHGGRSRTGFVLKAWAMRRHDWSEADAHDWLVTTWPWAHRDNPVFTRILEEGLA